jgi:Mg2+-importing ATPase
MNQPSNDEFWRLETEVLLERVQGRTTGLTRSEARDRLLQFGPNTVVDRRGSWLFLRFAKRFTEPLVAILLIAAVISGVTGDLASFAIILTVVALSIVLDVIQEHRAALAAEAL